MNHEDRLSGFFWLGMAIFVGILSYPCGIGTLRSPGPGFLPFWTAVLLGALSAVLVIAGKRMKREGALRDLWKDSQWNRVIAVLIALFLYSLLLPVLGYLVTTFGLMVFLLTLMKRSQAWMQVLTALIVVVSSYVIFNKLLDVKLPPGIAGF